MLQGAQCWRWLLTLALVSLMFVSLFLAPLATTFSQTSVVTQPVAWAHESASSQQRPSHLRGTPARAPSIVLRATAAYDGIYRIGSWLPIHTTVQNSGTDTSVAVRVQVPNGATFATTLDLPSGAHKSVTTHVFIPTFVRNLTVNVVNSGDAPGNARHAVLAQENLTLDPQPTHKLILATIAGDGMHTLQIPHTLTSDTPITTIPLTLQNLPEQVTGFSTFDTLVLNDVPTLELTDAQRRALTDWVLQGGHLLLAGGAGAPRTLEGLPAALRPLQVQETQPVQLGGGLGEIPVARGTPMEGMPPPYQRSSTLLPQAGPQPGGASAPPLLLEQMVGNGRVTFCAVALNDPVLLAWSEQERFWSDLLRQPQMQNPFLGSPDMPIETFTEGNFAASLTRLPSLELPSLVTLGILLLLYILLVGPLAYLVLRRLDKQALGWVIVPLITLIFAIIAYGLSYTQRGGDILLNQIALIEPLNGEHARARSFVGVFSPEERNYTIETTLTPPGTTTPLLRPVSLQGPWANQTNLGGTFWQQPAAAQASAHATNISIPRWSMRGIMSDDLIPYRTLSATVTLEGNTLHATITNNSSHPLQDVTLVQGNYVIRLKDMAAGEQHTTDALVMRESDIPQEQRFQHSPLSYLIYEEQAGLNITSPRFQPPPPDIQQRMALLDAVYPYERNRTMQPLIIAWADDTPLDASIPGQRVEQQQLALITFQPDLHIASNPVSLGTGWFRRRFEGTGVTNMNNTSVLCMGGNGAGISLMDIELVPEGVTEILHLPPELAGLQPDTLTLHLITDGERPEELVVDLFDWQSGAWVPHTLRNDRLPLDDPSRFLSRGGEIHIFFDPQRQSAEQLHGCLFLDAAVSGTLP